MIGGVIASAMGFGLVFRLVDEFSGPARNIEGQMASLDKRSSALSAAFGAAGKAMLGVSAGLTGIMGIGASAAIQFEATMRSVGMTSGLAGEELKQLGKDFDVLTATLPMSSQEMAEMAVVLGKMGVAEESGAAGLKALALTGTMLANTLGMGAEATAGLLGQLGTVYGISVGDAKAMRGLASALLEVDFASIATADQIGDMMVRSAQGARAIGLTAADVAALSGALLNAGVRVEAGGSNLSKVMVDMVGNAEKFSGFMDWAFKNVGKGAGMMADEFNRNMATDEGRRENFLRIMETLADIKFDDSVGGMVAYTRTLNALGWDGIREALVLGGITDGLKQNEKGQRKLTGWMDRSREAFEKGNAVSSRYNDMTATLSAKLAIATGSLKNISKMIGTTILPGLTKFADKVIESINEVLNWDEANVEVLSSLMQVAAAITGVAGAVLLLNKSVVLLGLPSLMAMLTAVMGYIAGFTGAITSGAALIASMGSAGIGAFFSILATGAVIGVVLLLKLIAVIVIIGGAIVLLIGFIQAFRRENETVWEMFGRWISNAKSAFMGLVEGITAAMGGPGGITEAFGALVEGIRPVLQSLGFLSDEGVNWRDVGIAVGAGLGALVKVFVAFAGALNLVLQLAIAVFRTLWNIGTLDFGELGSVWKAFGQSALGSFGAIMGTNASVPDLVPVRAGVGIRQGLSQAQAGGAGLGGGPGAAGGAETITVQSQIVLDGKVVGESVSKHQKRDDKKKGGKGRAAVTAGTINRGAI